MSRLRIRAARLNASVEETVRRILRSALADEEPVGTMIRRLVAGAAQDLDLPVRELDDPIDFATPDYDVLRRT